MPDNYFIPLKALITVDSLPERFTFPFYYQPHPLCILAVQALQQYLETQTAWRHYADNNTASDEHGIGKMFGVLVVQNKQGETGYLAAFSGQLAGKNNWPHFVPPVFDVLEEQGFFRKGQAEINQLNQRIVELEQNLEIQVRDSYLKAELAEAEQQIQSYRQTMIAGRRIRKAKRIKAQENLNKGEFEQLNLDLAKQSVLQKNQLKELTIFWQQRIEFAEQQLHSLTDEIVALKQRRKAQSKALQERLFEQYVFLNSKGDTKGLKDIFSNTVQGQPPAGAGDCAAPKLLQYAFSNGFKPLAMAEFWWGASPKSEIRQHGHFYGSCQGKCQPILAHMLAGMAIDDNPLLRNPAIGKTINIVYEDEAMVVINKPAGFLSVPGKHIEDSVYSRMLQQYPNATGPLIVHRLDMSTSGLMVIALTKQVHKKLQQQFIKRTVKKRYIALLEGVLAEDSGFIDLPLRVDLDDRPRQLVCYDYGRAAQTQWHVVERYPKQTKVYFYPITGRTHQLRVHSAHVKGLNMPIVGDDLYGRLANRLHLHAESLEIAHPMTAQRMSFQVNAEF